MVRNTVQISIGSGAKFLEGFVEAGLTITPGQIVHLNPNGTYSNFFPDTTWEDNYPTLIAIENYDEGKGVDETYAGGEKICMRYLRRGDVAWMLMATQKSVAFGDFLIPASGGYGDLQVKSVFVGEPYYFGMALSSATGIAGVKARVKVEIR